MDKLEYFSLMVKEGVYKKRDWVISVFCVLRKRPIFTEAEYFGQIIVDPKDPDHLYWFDNRDESNVKAVPIQGSSIHEALYRAKETVHVKANMFPLITEDMNTTYGIILGNMYLLWYPFGGKIPYSHKPIGSWIEDQITEKLHSDPMNGEERDPNVFYISEVHKLSEACGLLASLAPIFAASGSAKMLTVDKSVIKLRDELIEKNKDKLTDKTTLALIEEALVAADKATFKDDEEARDFLISGKSFNPSRKKMYVMIGGSSGFGQGGEMEFIGGSLQDKWKPEDIPIHADEARSGSYFRGKETQFGGADVKVAYRMSMTMSVSDDFCGTTSGRPVSITENTKSSKYVGRYVVTTKGPVEITNENFPQLIGKTVSIYSPMRCKAPGSEICPVCIGKTYSGLKYGIPSIVANIGDVFMYDKMKRMHGKPLESLKVDINQLIA